LASLALLVAGCDDSDGDGAGSSAGPAVRTLAVGANSTTVATSNATGRAFVLSRGPLDPLGNPVRRGTVAIVDLRKATVADTVVVGVDPQDVAVNDRNNRVYVVNGGAFTLAGDRSARGSISVLAPATRAVRTVPAGIGPSAVAADVALDRVVVVNRGEPPGRGSVMLLEAGTGKRLQTIAAGVHPADVEVDRRRHRAFVANFVSNTVAVLDLARGRLLQVRRLGPPPGTLAKLVVADAGAHLLALELRPRVSGGGGPPFGRVIVLSAATARTIRTTRVTDPADLATDSRGGRFYVSEGDRHGGHASAWATRTGARLWRVPLRGRPGALAVDARGRRLFVANTSGTTVTELETAGGRHVRTIDVGFRARALAVDDRTRRLIVVGGGRVAIVSLAAPG
jgi:DNA-binding beta-propeller fold protein YncE